MRSLINFILNTVKNAYMIRSIVIRELRMRYIGSAMGFFWAFIHPLMLTLIYTFIFSAVLKVKIQTLAEGIRQTGVEVPFAVWFLTGLLPWNLLAESVSASASVVLNNSSLIKKTVFPSEILPLATLITNFINHIIGLIILFVLMHIMGVIPNYVNLFYIPLYILPLFMFIMGISWIVASLNVFLRDIGQVIGLVLQTLFFATPIIYQVSMVPYKYLRFMKINPMYFFVEGYRNAIIPNYSQAVLWSKNYLIYVVLVSFFTFALGGTIFRSLKWSFAKVM